MRVEILKPVKEKPKYKVGMVITVLNDYGKKLIKKGLAKATDRPQPEDAYVQAQIKKEKEDNIQHVEVTHKVEDSEATKSTEQ